MIADGYARAKADGADIAIFPELMICRAIRRKNLVLRPTVIEDCRKACEATWPPTLGLAPALCSPLAVRETTESLQCSAVDGSRRKFKHVRLKHAFCELWTCLMNAGFLRRGGRYQRPSSFGVIKIGLADL